MTGQGPGMSSQLTWETPLPSTGNVQLDGGGTTSNSSDSGRLAGIGIRATRLARGKRDGLPARMPKRKKN
eukprot:CAMPEP_0179918002 /NCGR_PEP_ID=MMETSP0983-20121128/3154_1 /TAXON_ID=483367 /ORGANISM="non described non described, Strain CCMP 2436" /LENGTH=69 /DNA_ID=CAMNT_0021820815 /DNA_START=412 /DNA_END=622 /DNA_ORIENTATION=+